LGIKSESALKIEEGHCGYMSQAHDAMFQVNHPIVEKAVAKCFAGMIPRPRSVVLYAGGVIVALDTAR
jgi:hypothetical protein